MSTSLFARNLARRTIERTLRAKVVAPQYGAIRFTSYYTPGEFGSSLYMLSLKPWPGSDSLRFFSTAHEYIKVDGNTGTVGITDFAQSALGDIVFVDLPETDDEYEKGDSFGSVESVKAASDVYCPVSGTIVEVNEVLTDEPGLVNTNAEDSAWFVKMEISDASELESLMDEAAYKAHCEKESN